MSKSYTVTALVSVYNAERFLRACLEDLVAQSIFEHMEVIIIDACSPQNEGAIAREFTAKYPNILYERTEKREGLYASWNRALRKARGIYITNANADDRHAPKALETLAAELNAHPEVALVYANSRVTAEENAAFSTAPLRGRLVLPKFSYLRLLYESCIGPQPMWRRSVHEQVGYFDESYIIAGDYDMWLRMAEHYPMKHVPKMLGLFLQNEQNLAHSNAKLLQAEEERLCTRALTHFVQTNTQTESYWAAQWADNEAALQEVLQKQQSGKNVTLQDLEFHWYAKALLLAKMKKYQEATHLLAPFLTHGAKAHRLIHLHTFISQYLTGAQ